jgi:hypothetical protein
VVDGNEVSLSMKDNIVGAAVFLNNKRWNDDQPFKGLDIALKNIEQNPNAAVYYNKPKDPDIFDRLSPEEMEKLEAEVKRRQAVTRDLIERGF